MASQYFLNFSNTKFFQYQFSGSGSITYVRTNGSAGFNTGRRRGFPADWTNLMEQGHSDKLTVSHLFDYKGLYNRMMRRHMDVPTWNVSCTQGIPLISWNPEVQHFVYNSPPLVPVVSQINSFHVPPFYLFKINFHIVTPSTVWSST